MHAAAIQFTCSVDISALMIYLSTFKDWIKFSHYKYFLKKTILQRLAEFYFKFFFGEIDWAVVDPRSSLKTQAFLLKGLV